MKKFTYYLQNGRSCPQCNCLCAVLLEIATGRVLEHCGSCKRNWSNSVVMTELGAENLKKALATE